MWQFGTKLFDLLFCICNEGGSRIKSCIFIHLSVLRLYFSCNNSFYYQSVLYAYFILSIHTFVCSLFSCQCIHLLFIHSFIQSFIPSPNQNLSKHTNIILSLSVHAIDLWSLTRQLLCDYKMSIIKAYGWKMKFLIFGEFPNLLKLLMYCLRSQISTQMIYFGKKKYCNVPKFSDRQLWAV